MCQYATLCGNGLRVFQKYFRCKLISRKQGLLTFSSLLLIFENSFFNIIPVSSQKAIFPINLHKIVSHLTHSHTMTPFDASGKQAF